MPNLLNGLVSHWKMDEANGNALDSVGSNTLTDTNTVTSNPGKINTARQFTNVNGEFFTMADNATVSCGGHTHFAVGGWFYFDTVAATMHLIAKRVANIEYWLRWDSGASRLQFMVTHDGATQKTVNWSAATSTATWYYILGWHDPDLDIIAIQVNGGTPVTAAHSLGMFDGTSAFEIGAGNTNERLDGRADECSLWKNRQFSAADGVFLYNNGNGLPLSQFSGYDPTLIGQPIAKPIGLPLAVQV